MDLLMCRDNDHILPIFVKNGDIHWGPFKIEFKIDQIYTHEFSKIWNKLIKQPIFINFILCIVYHPFFNHFIYQASQLKDLESEERQT